MLRRASEKQSNTIVKHGEKQVEALKSLECSGKESSIKNFISERMLNPEIMNELENIREQEWIMLYKEYKTIYDFAKFKTIQSFEMLLGMT